MAASEDYERADLTPDELVERLVPEPGVVPDLKILVGYVGKGSREGVWRLYLTPELDEYVDISDEDVLHSASLDKAQHPLGGTMLWVQRDTKLSHTRTGSSAAQADFLGGAISNASIAGIGGLAGLRAAIGFGMAASGTGLCTLDSKCITSVEGDSFCPKLTSPISTSKCACVLA